MSMVAVGLAMAEYRLPRLRRLWTHLEGQKGGIGLRGGPGEKQIETDRRKVERRIFELKQEMKLMEGRKERTVRARKSEHCLVSLVGYTNAGKSTLMRALTGEDVEIQDKLFCTLDTKTSALNLGGGLRVMLSDTVGFIRRLPHHLVASFHATLEEARAGDLLLHVVDISSPWAREQLDAVKEVLTRVGCDHNEVQLVFNKIDRVTPERKFEAGLLMQEYPGAIQVSALQGTGLEELKSLIRSRVGAQASPIVVQVHAGDGKTLAFLATHFFEDAREYKDEWVRLSGRATKAVLDRLRRAGPTVEILEGEFTAPPDPWKKESAEAGVLEPLEPGLPEVTNP
jgi:GTP-binding protein HflX